MENTKIYAEVLEDEAMEQFKSAIAQPYSVSGALMPDAHTGYSLPIGAVVATDGFIYPAWVGYDIGCGMCAIQLKGIQRLDIEMFREDIFNGIYKSIPVGFSKNQHSTDYSLEGLTGDGMEIAMAKDYQKAICSLGGGNHFIEIGFDENDSIWIVIHSGSRGVGHGIAAHYIRKAHPENKCKEGHYGFSVNSEEGKNYIKDLNWCLEYALNNRKAMIGRVIDVVEGLIGGIDYNYDELINRNHNHAVESDGLWIHRKGATHAEEGMMGVIPGNMRDGSFIVRGKGNPESLSSSSHGAGRVMGRKQAKRDLDFNDFKEAMDGVTALVEESTLDEAPMAYKNIFEVMELQKDLVEVVAHIRPLINIKG